MRIAEAHDYGKDDAELWLQRLRHIRPVLRFSLDLFHSLFLVAFTTSIGAVAGALVASLWGDGPFWYGMAAGGVLGMVLGVNWVKRVFFSDPRGRASATQARVALSAGAYRWPGVEERFSRMRTRGLALVSLMGGALLGMAYLKATTEEELPQPFSMPVVTLNLILLGLIVALAALLALNSRCPKCRHLLWKAFELRECPHCGVVLRAFEP